MPFLASNYPSLFDLPRNMSETEAQIRALETRLDLLVRTQIDFQKEVSAIRAELKRLRSMSSENAEDPTKRSFYDPAARPAVNPSGFAAEPTPPQRPRTASYQPPRDPEPIFSGSAYSGAASEPASSGNVFSRTAERYTQAARTDFEKFIGENLISKIGIVVLVLGVGIGTKYAIDNDLISPLTRIVIGYIFGFGLVGLAIRLKPKYLNFSAVLISGGMAIMYFLTYFAYSAYGLISQPAAFALMLMFTAFTVTAALLYNRQVIAHFGLVGAYAVPFLLSSDSGNYAALFFYMTIVNLGILAISLKRSWVPIFYTSFFFTWVIFAGWIATRFEIERHFQLALTFLSVFFSLFLAVRVAQRRDEEAEVTQDENLIGALLNGVVFFLFCFAITQSVAGEKVWAFFGYLATATAAILAVSFRFYRQAFVYLCFPFAWLIYAFWFFDRYDPQFDRPAAATFAAVFFSILYFTLLYHRLRAGTFTFIEHTTAILSNSFIFYGFGYAILDGAEATQPYLGIFTVANSALHLTVARIVGRFRDDAVDVVHVLTILVLTFATIAVPVQLDGNFVTLIWCVEAALLYWYGRAKRIRLFEYCSYPLIALATMSMFLDWFALYSRRTPLPSEFNNLPIANGDLVTALVFVAAFGFIYYVNRLDELPHPMDEDLKRPIGLAIGTAALFVLYNALRIEIGNYHHNAIAALRASAAETPIRSIADLESLNIIWQLDYSIVFVIALGAANLVRIRSAILAAAVCGMALCLLSLFSTAGMVLFSDLRESYMYSGGDWLNIAIRYISYTATALLLLTLHRYVNDREAPQYALREPLRIAFEAVAHAVIFIALSCELLNVMGQLSIPDATKLGLSILWGIYALVLVVIGIARDRRHLRIAAFALLGVTLAKLFLYDIADLDTIPKTILFITLGLTLLLISFLYNKYKDMIFGTTVTGADEE